MSEDPYAIQRRESARQQKIWWDEIADEFGLDPDTTNVDMQSAIRRVFLQRHPLWA
jgi:hypothetical protein